MGPVGSVRVHHRRTRVGTTTGATVPLLTVVTDLRLRIRLETDVALRPLRPGSQCYVDRFVDLLRKIALCSRISLLRMRNVANYILLVLHTAIIALLF